MKRAALVAVLGIAGCDSLFNLDHVADPGGRDGGNGDGRGSDANAFDGPDATTCTPIGHNEDTDNYDDACDSCPTVENLDVDQDGDGLDDACDPDLGTSNLDRILLAVTFRESYSVDFNASGTIQYDSSNKGNVTVLGNTVLTTKVAYHPTQIVIRTSQVGQGLDAQVNVMHSGATCQVVGSDCTNTTTTTTCVHALPNGNQNTLVATSPSVRSIVMRGSDVIECSISTSPDGTTPATAKAPITLGTSTLQLTTNSNGAVIIDSIVIYGSQ